MKLIVFGATGNTGLALLEQGHAAGHAMTAFVRRPEALGELAKTTTVITGSLDDNAAVEAAVRGQAVVLSALGTRPWKHQDICSTGTRAITRAMVAMGINRIIVTSSQGVGDSRVGPFAKLFTSLVLRKAFHDKCVMEDELAATKLDWISVRPGLLTNGKPRGTWRTDDTNALRGGRIARADVAAFMLQQLTGDTWVRRRPVIVW
jgi:putative NADH-flavin reductase